MRAREPVVGTTSPTQFTTETDDTQDRRHLPLRGGTSPYSHNAARRYHSPNFWKVWLPALPGVTLVFFARVSIDERID